MNPFLSLDDYAIAMAQRVHRRHHAIQCSGYTGTFGELMFASIADQTALATFTSEASLFAGTNRLPIIPSNFFSSEGKSLLLHVSGVLGSTSTPTFLWKTRLHTAAVTATSSISGTVVGVTVAITAGSGVTNQQWDLFQWLTCKTPGVGSTACTLNCHGFIQSGGLATPFHYPLQPTTPPTATWTATIDQSVTYYPNLTLTCGSSDASNTATVKSIKMYGLN